MKCPKCMQTVKDNSTDCEYCGSPFPSNMIKSNSSTKDSKKNSSWLKKLFKKNN